MAIVEPAGSGGSGRRRLRLRNPATLEPLDEFEVETEEDVRAAVERARKAQPEWAALKISERGRILCRAIPHLIDRQEELVDAIVRETGKPKPEALAEAMAARRQGGTLRMQRGYDHSYFFVSSFIEDHLAFHADALNG